MRTILNFAFCLLFCCLSAIAYSQGRDQKPKSSAYYINTLKNSKDSLYARILLEFDNYFKQHPNDVDARIEKCIVINQAYYDEYDGYSSNYEEFEICLNDLIQDFPENEKVLLYKLEQLYGDSVITFCQKIIDKNQLKPGQWADYQLAKVYEKLAHQYSYEEGEILKVITHAEKAEELNDSLDLSLLLAQQFMAKNRYDLAKQQLFRSLDSLDETWESTTKGNLLLKLGEPDKALQAYDFVKDDTTAWIDNGMVARALIENGKPQEAREFFLKDLEVSYGSSATLHELFAYDYKHSPADTALATYNRLNTSNFLNDALGKYRLMMIFKSPLSGWEITDALKLLILVIIVVVLLVLPYLWVLPLHYLSDHFKWKELNSSLNASRWGLRDFWIICSAALLLEFLTSLVFNYEGLISYFLNDLYIDEVVRISLDTANTGLFYFIGMLVLVLMFIRKNDYRYLLADKWSMQKGILTGMGLAFLLRVVYFSMVKVGLLPNVSTSVITSIQDYFTSISTYYHSYLSFLLIVVLIPFYEEYLFRGIALNAMEKRIKFIAANMIQSTVFALLHDNLNLFIFYFTFGMIAGLLIRRSNSIAPSIAFHMTNNLFAFIAMSRLG
ncbi:MAG: CPBP family glutamic-type intramembrane protease [Reichenbachiella sp.]|uniref:CPBP family glutamic-type intramembrane protease n=1 Tax=Reichenbachiella sp. TaxID=2184521 RepID=UPI003267D2F8